MDLHFLRDTWLAPSGAGDDGNDYNGGALAGRSLQLLWGDDEDDDGDGMAAATTANAEIMATTAAKTTAAIAP